MAEATSPTTGRCYGVARVCRVWAVPRSSFYAARQPKADTTTAAAAVTPARRGPKPAVSDAALLAAIRADLTRSPWTGEGHRKVWARLRAIDGIRVSRKRVLRLMRQHALLSPHRAQSRPEASHERQIITAAPNIMWATEATQITTVADGKVWLFSVAEHWNAELLGWHVAKHGTASRRSRPSAWRCASSSATSAPGRPAPWRSVTTTAAPSWRTCSRSRSGSGAWRRATPPSASPRRTDASRGCSER